MAGTNGEDGMSSKARNVGSRPLCGERDLINWGLLARGWSRRGEGKRLFVDSDRSGLRSPLRLSG